MIGLVPLRRFSPEYIKQLIANSPFSAGRHRLSLRIGGDEFHV